VTVRFFLGADNGLSDGDGGWTFLDAGCSLRKLAMIEFR
jgi:hypothetical protein